MTTPAEIQQLRTRARHLRDVAGQLGASRATELHRLAGPDTWVGPVPQSCRDALLALRRQLHAGEEALHGAARRLERLADELQARAAMSTGVS